MCQIYLSKNIYIINKHKTYGTCKHFIILNWNLWDEEIKG